MLHEARLVLSDMIRHGIEFHNHINDACMCVLVAKDVPTGVVTSIVFDAVAEEGSPIIGIVGGGFGLCFCFVVDMFCDVVSVMFCVCLT